LCSFPTVYFTYLLVFRFVEYISKTAFSTVLPVEVGGHEDSSSAILIRAFSSQTGDLSISSLGHSLLRRVIFPFSSTCNYNETMAMQLVSFRCSFSVALLCPKHIPIFIGPNTLNTVASKLTNS